MSGRPTASAAEARASRVSQDLEVAPGPIADAPGSGGADAPLTRRLERSRWILAISLGGIARIAAWA